MRPRSFWRSPAHQVSNCDSGGLADNRAQSCDIVCAGPTGPNMATVTILAALLATGFAVGSAWLAVDKLG